MSPNKVLYDVRQIEHMEVELTTLNAARSLSAVPKQLEVMKAGHCTLLRDLTEPGSIYYNRIKGFGPSDMNSMDELLAYYGEFPPCFDMTPDHLTEEVSSALSSRGFIPVEQLVFMKIHLPEGMEPDHTSGIEKVTASNAEAFIAWIGLSSGGKAFDPAVIDRVKTYFYRPDFLNYMMTVEGEPAAMGSLFLHGEEGYLANDYTFEAFRGRGCQTALLRHRLSAAAGLGIKTVYTDVEFGSLSHSNMEKMGFRTVFMNTFWVKNN